MKVEEDKIAEDRRQFDKQFELEKAKLQAEREKTKGD